MSARIDTVEILSSQDFSILLDRFEAIRDEIPGDSIAEINPFELWPEDGCEIRDGRLYPTRICWGGEGSYSTLEVFYNDLVAKFDGAADLLVHVEGALEGARLRDHKVTMHEVVVTLGNEVECTCKRW